MIQPESPIAKIYCKQDSALSDGLGMVVSSSLLFPSPDIDYGMVISSGLRFPLPNIDYGMVISSGL
jgi:hypothetical protein